MGTQALPSWLDDKFLATVLQSGDETASAVTVARFSAVLAVGAGNNYMSRLYRVRVEYTQDQEEKVVSLIVKAPLEAGVVKEMSGSFDFYDKEPKMYNKFLPIVNSMLKLELGPKSYTNTINNAIVLADLKELGFEMCDRFKQLDFHHCEQVLKALAKFHAASVACKRDHPEVIDLVGQEIFYKQNDKFDSQMKGWLQGSVHIVSGIVREMNLSEEAASLIFNRVDTVADSGIRLCQPKTSGLNVLNHGDLWGNNILFKHSDSGNVVDIRFIDFQLTRYASPVLDVIYFVWSSADENVRESKLQELFDTYILTLNTTLEQLGCEERMTSEEFQEDMRGALDWVLVTICNMLPIILCDVKDVVNVEEVTYDDVQEGERDEKFLKLYKGEHFRAKLPKVIEHLERWVDYYKCG